MSRNPPQVGAPDPEHRNSPILDDEEAEFEPSGQDIETGVCYFNDVAYALGDYVLSGNELLRCEARGVWVKEGELRPDAKIKG